MDIKHSFNNLTDTHITIYGNGSKAITEQELKNTFTTYYQNHFKTISLLIEDDKKPIDDIYVNLAIIKEEKEEDIKDKSKLLDRDKIINSYEEIYKPKEPIDIEELIEKSSKFNSAKALIYGKAGIGKTTFCKYIAYRWAKGELYSEFENIVYITLREWKEDGLESIIKKIYFEEKHKNEAIEIDSSKTLFLFDGYDELSDTSLLHGAIKKYNLQNYIITSRPYGYRKSDFDVNEVFETIGFTDENVTAYIDKFFEEQSHKTNLQNFLKQNINIKHIAYIPLMLEMICSLWREKAKSNQPFSSPMTMTELYSEVIEYIFFEYSETNNTAYIQEREDEIFDYLGKIAFEGLKRQVIVLDKSIIKEKKDFFVDYVLKTGFLKSDRKYRNPLMSSYEFPHLTFQEYFSALYVSKLPKEEISEVIRDYKFYPYMQVFFAFLGGLIEDKEFFLNKIESEPRDLVGLYEILLRLNCLSEIKVEKIRDIKKINKEIVYWITIVCGHEKLGGGYTQFRNFFDKLKNISHLLNDNTLSFIIKIIEDTNNEISIPKRERIVEDYLVYLFKDSSMRILHRLSTKPIYNSVKESIWDTLNSLVSGEEIKDKIIISDVVEGRDKETIESLFLRFDHFTVSFKDIAEVGMYYIIPIYIKDDKLHSFFNGIEYRTKNIHKEKIVELNSSSIQFKEESIQTTAEKLNFARIELMKIEKRREELNSFLTKLEEIEKKLEENKNIEEKLLYLIKIIK